MKRSGHESFILEEGGQFYGFVLTGDGYAEHESSVQKLRWAFGIPEISRTNLGLEGRRIRTIPQGYLGYQYLPAQGRAPYAILTASFSQDPALYFGKKMWDSLTWESAWDEQSFIIRVRKKDHKQQLEDLHQAFLVGDVAFVNYGSLSPFGRGGLAIVIVSRVPTEHADKLLEGDLANLELQEAIEATGILQELEAAGKGPYKGYYACSGAWTDDTKQALRFWLNPREQDLNNYGWFTVTQLRQWIAGEGPIPKTPEEVEAYRDKMGYSRRR